MSLLSKIRKGIEKHPSKNKFVKNVVGTLNGIFPEIKMFVNKPCNNQLGLRFWIASSYVSTSLTEKEHSDFIAKNVKMPFPMTAQEKEKYGFTRNNLSFLKLTNIVQPLVIGIEYVKSKIAAGVDHLFSEGMQTESSTLAKGIKAGIQVLILPIELPLLLASKTVELTLDVVSFIGKKIKSAFTAKPDEIEMDKIEEPSNTVKPDPELVTVSPNSIASLSTPQAKLVSETEVVDTQNSPTTVFVPTVEVSTPEIQVSANTTYINSRLAEGALDDNIVEVSAEIEPEHEEEPKKADTALRSLPVMEKLLKKGYVSLSFMAHVIEHNEAHSEQSKFGSQYKK